MKKPLKKFRSQQKMNRCHKKKKHKLLIKIQRALSSKKMLNKKLSQSQILKNSKLKKMMRPLTYSMKKFKNKKNP